jgi:alpha-tubulin suppressor-like RCC1 family protein
MPWNLIDNTNLRGCEPTQQWTKIVMGNTQSYGIDNLGRLFSWGAQGGNGIGMSGHHGSLTLSSPETYPSDPDTDVSLSTAQMTTAKQILAVGNRSPWVDIQSGEYAAIARNVKGELWIVGNIYYGLAGTGVGDDAQTGQFTYSNSTDTWSRIGTGFTAIDLVKIENESNVPYWNDYAMGWYHVLGLYEGSLYIWGQNINGNDFGDTSEIAVDEITNEATLVTWIPGNPTIKLIAANYSASAVVTSDDKIYWWGDSVNDGAAISTPTLVTGLVIPDGETIEQIDITAAQGLVVRLSDGSIHANGYFNMPVSGSPSFQLAIGPLTQFPPSQHVEVEYFTLASLSRSGDIHAIGGFNYFLSRDDSSYNVTEWNEPYLVQASNEGARISNAFSIGVFYANGLIDDRGRLWTWGINTYGMLAIGENAGDVANATSAQIAAQAASWRGIAWTSSEEHDNSDFEEQVLLNDYSVEGISPYFDREVALKPPHHPHWHKQLFDAEFLSDCWRPVVAIDGAAVCYVACGNNLYNFMILSYHIDNNVWTILHVRDGDDENTLFCCEMEGGAAIAGDVYCFHNWKEDVTLTNGDRLLPVFSGQSLATWVVDNTSGAKTLNYTEWAGTNKLHGRNKIACNNNGLVACIIEDSSDWIVKVSSDYGLSWSDSKTLAFAADRIDFGVVINELSHIYIFYYDIGAKTITVEKSDDSGGSWSTQGTISSVLSATNAVRIECSFQLGALFVSAEDGLGAAEFYYSTDDGASWTTRDLPTGRLFYMADPDDESLYNMAPTNETDKFTEDYTESSPTFVDGAPTPDANGVNVYTISDRGYLKNSAQYGVHANRYSVYRALGSDDPYEGT